MDVSKVLLIGLHMAMDRVRKLRALSFGAVSNLLFVR